MSARLSDERSDGSDTSDSDYDSAAPVQNATEDPATVTDTAATGKSEADGVPDATAVETAIATAVGIALVDEAVANLGASDAYCKQLSAWLAKLTAMPAEQRPPKPPVPDAHALGSIGDPRSEATARHAVRQEARRFAV